MRRPVLLLSTAALISTSMSCGGGGSPTGPAPTPTPVAVATATPAPSTPTPVACANCEAPTTNTNPPTEIRLRMYQVRRPNGDPAPCLNEDPVAPGGPTPGTRYWFAPVPVGYRVKLDATAYDQFGKATNSDCSDDNRGCITWRFGDGENLIDDYSLGHIFQPTFRVSGSGDFQIQAEMYNNGSRVRSPWYWMKFIDDPAGSPCSR